MAVESKRTKQILFGVDAGVIYELNATNLNAIEFAKTCANLWQMLNFLLLVSLVLLSVVHLRVRQQQQLQQLQLQSVQQLISGALIRQ